MARLGRMHEISAGAGARHGRGDLARDVAAFADAADDDAAGAAGNQLERRDELRIEPLDQRAHRLGFSREHAPRELERFCGVIGFLRNARGLYHAAGV